MITLKRQLGDTGEALVADYLKQQGYTILQHNYQQKCGEIDLIASNTQELLFVEVKLRNNQYFDLSQVITYSKQKKIINAAHLYLAENKNNYASCRFDVALIEMYEGAPRITYIADAFGQDY